MQHPGGEVTPERGAGEPEEPLQPVDHDVTPPSVIASSVVAASVSRSSCPGSWSLLLVGAVLSAGVLRGEGGVVDAGAGGAELGLVDLGDEAGVVDPGRGRQLGWGLGSGLEVGVAPDPVRDRGAGRDTAQPDLDAGEVERVEHQLDAAPDQQRVDLVGVALQRHQRGLGDGALFFPEERLGQRVGARDRERAGGAPAGERGRCGLGVDLAVVDGLDPRGEQRVELAQVGDRVPARIALGVPGDLDEELLADGPEVAFDLPAALRPTRGGVDQPDAELRAGAQQPGVDERRAVVDVDPVGDPARTERGAQRGRQAHGVLGEPEPMAHDRPGVVVEEREQIRLAAADVRAVQGVTGPQLVGPQRLEPPEHRPGRARCDVRSAICGSSANQRCRVRSPGAHPIWVARIRRTCAPVRSGFSRLSATAISTTSTGNRGARLARAGHQRVEPAAPPRPDPPIQRVARDPHPAPGRVECARPRRPRGPAGPGPGSTAPGRPPPGSARSGTARSPGPAPIAWPRHLLWPPSESHLLVVARLTPSVTRQAAMITRKIGPGQGELVLINPGRPERASPAAATGPRRPRTRPARPAPRRSRTGHPPPRRRPGPRRWHPPTPTRPARAAPDRA